MKKLSYVKLQSFFSFSAASLFGTQQQLAHPPVKSSTVPLRKMPVSQGVAPWHPIFTSPCITSRGTQQHLTHPLVNSSILPLRKMSIFQGVAPWHTNFFLSCVIPLWDFATAYSPSGKEFVPSFLDELCFSGLIVI